MTSGSAESQSSPVAKPARTILVVEDNSDTQKILTRQLENQKYGVVCKGDGPAALAWLSSNNADLVLLDVMLPDMDGMEICRQIRKSHSPSELPVIMLSALGGDSKDRVRGLKAGANDYMAKPYHFDELLVRIQMFLQVKSEAENAENLLSRYLSSALRKQARLDPELLERREARRAVVMFADLRGFTKLSAVSQARDVLGVLDEFFEAMMRVVEDHGGIIFDIAGDELLAVFNVPYEVPVANFLAVQAAVEMQRLFRALQSQWAKAGFEVGLGIGIHQGEVMIGNIGAGSLQRYTVMGNVVNMANRLLALAKDGEVIISPEVYRGANLPGAIAAEAESGVILKGIETPQEIYRIRAASAT